MGGLGMILSLIPEYLRNTEERVPKVTPGPFTTDVSVYGQPPGSGLRVTWFGHSSTLLEVDGVKVLLDPVWDERASPLTWMGPKRFFAPTVPLESLPRVDAVLISHDHYDHLGRQTVTKLAALWPEVRWVTSLGVGATLRGFGVAAERVTELDWTESTTVQGADEREVVVTAVPARHFSGRSVANRFETLWSAFVLRGDRHNVYFGADSGMWAGFAAIGERFGPFDLAMLEIGAFDERWKAIHLGPDGAVEAFAKLRAKMLMPIHWGLFDLALHGWRQPVERVREVADGRGIVLVLPEPGVPTEVVEGMEVRSDWFR